MTTYLDRHMIYLKRYSERMAESSSGVWSDGTYIFFLRINDEGDVDNVTFKLKYPIDVFTFSDLFEENIAEKSKETEKLGVLVPRADLTKHQIIDYINSWVDDSYFSGAHLYNVYDEEDKLFQDKKRSEYQGDNKLLKYLNDIIRDKLKDWV